MRIDVLTIFPDYLAPLALSLPGRARAARVFDLTVHDLRTWTHDRHHSVDDRPIGGGAGMVMKPEPWGEALDEVAPDGAVLVVPSPAGERFNQALAADLATREHLVIACGRYEGIDQRVLEDAAGRLEVREVSLGDYVLNGGEVAALAIVEAVVRLLPGFMGNAESLAEESHGSDGLLEYPVYTRPASWRGRDVPEVLLSGDHARIGAWRHEQSVRRTVERRPDLLAPTVLDEVAVRPGVPSDAGELWVLMRACWVQEAQDNPDVVIPALHESMADVRAWLVRDTVLVARAGGRLVGAVLGRREGSEWYVGRLMVAGDLAGRGLGRRLLAAIEALAPEDATGFTLVTGAGSTRNLRMYKKAGYRVVGQVEPGVVRLSRRRARADG